MVGVDELVDGLSWCLSHGRGENITAVAVAKEGSKLKDVCGFVSSFGLKEVDGKRMPDRDCQQKAMEVHSLLVGCVRFCKEKSIRYSCLRCIGNLILGISLHVEEEFRLFTKSAVECGAVHLAMDILRDLNASIDEKREALRILNNIASSSLFDDLLHDLGATEELCKVLSTFATDEEEVKLISMAVGCVSHLCYNESNKDRLFHGGIADALLPIAASKSQKHKFVRAMMGVACLVGEEEKHPALKASEELVESITAALVASINRLPYPPNSNTFNEPFNVMKSLFFLAGNDNNKRLFLKFGTVKVLVDILHNESNSELLLERASATLRRLCFDKEVATALNNMPGLKSFLQRSTGQSPSRKKPKMTFAESISALAWQLENVDVDKRKETSATRPSVSVSKSQVMLSYNWSHQEIVLRVNSYLQDHNIKTWIDVEQMQGSTLEAMSRAVESSEVVLVFFSKDYKNSANCRLEADYAHKLGKHIIPVRVDSYDPDGWLGLLLGTKLWYDVQDANDVAVLSKLFDEVSSNLRRQVHPPQPKTPPKETPSSMTPKRVTSTQAPAMHMSPQLALQPPRLSDAVLGIGTWSKEDVMAFVQTVGDHKLTHLFESTSLSSSDSLMALAISSVLEGPVAVAGKLREFMVHKQRLRPHFGALLAFSGKLYALGVKESAADA
eukprot:m.93433 g.93433  ORF g.93433 m.93433 type:complete len:672 (-) comp12385_c0_seq1:67-2082(-)